MTDDIPLVLGGHSFIQQLGNEPKPSEAAQIELVDTCLDNGITWFDTTYLPERIALGRALSALGRRSQACILAWNFFRDFADEQSPGGPERLEEHHIRQMLDQLKTDYIDFLVVHPVGEERDEHLQEDVARIWLESGLVRRLGTWNPTPNRESEYRKKGFCTFMVRPYNIATKASAPAFAMGKRLGWENLACSPFVRGRVLEETVRTAVARDGGAAADVRAKIADLMLRFSLFQDDVDRLIVAMRRARWVHANIESVHRGRLTEEETAYLMDLRGKT